jgi:ornithine cyclodeaminase
MPWIELSLTIRANEQEHIELALEDLGAIVSGDTPGRRNDEEIIILSVGGMAVEDVAWGTMVYRNAIANGIGVKLNLWEEPALK